MNDETILLPNGKEVPMVKLCASNSYSLEQKELIFGNTIYTTFDNFWDTTLQTELSCCKRFIELFGLDGIVLYKPVFQGIGFGDKGGCTICYRGGIFNLCLNEVSGLFTGYPGSSSHWQEPIASPADLAKHCS